MHLFEQDDTNEFHDLRDRMRDLAQRVHGLDHPFAKDGWRLPDQSSAIIGLYADVHSRHYLEIEFMKRAVENLESELYAQPYQDFDDAWRPSSRQHAKRPWVQGKLRR